MVDHGPDGRLSPYEAITRSLSVDYLWAPDPLMRESQIAKAVGVTPGRDPAMLRARILCGGPAELIEQIVRDAVWRKELKHHVGEPGFIQPARTMSAIGG